MTEPEMHHRIALARELTAMAGCKLRDRYGFAASDESVQALVEIVFAQPDDETAVAEIGAGNIIGTLELADGYDTPTDEDYERRIVAALRPLVEDRRRAAGKALR